MASDRNPIVQFQDVSLRLPDGRTIVSGLDFGIHDSETLVLLGRSGSGKTTTLRLINRLLMPTSGRVIVEGMPTAAWEPTRLRRRTGYVIQEIGLFPHLSVAENVAIVPTLEGWEEARKRERVNELLELVGLEPASFADRFPAELSGGQRQRVGVARALAANPPLLLLDEPFGALDPLTRIELRCELKKLQARLGKTMVFVTHDIREALFLATRIALFQGGRLVFLGSPRDFQRSQNPEAQAFVKALEESNLDPTGGRP